MSKNKQKTAENAVTVPPKQRVWEVDAFRGLMILFVIWDHFMWAINDAGASVYREAMYEQICDFLGIVAHSSETYKTWLFTKLYDLSVAYYGGALRKTTHDVFVMMFVLLSGVSCSFSRNNLNRAIKMTVFAVALSVITNLVGMPVNFNVIHVITVCVWLWCAVELWQKSCKKPWQKNLFGATMFVWTVFVLTLGYCLQNGADGIYKLAEDGFLHKWLTSDNRIFFFLYEHTGSAFHRFWGMDYLALIPAMGWFVVGAFLGQKLYPSKKSLFPSVDEKWVKPLTVCGKYSIWIYFIGTVMVIGFVIIFHAIFNII